MLLTRRDFDLARAEGRRAGAADKLMGVKSDLTLGRDTLPESWHNAYAEGYEQGQP